MNAVTQKIEQMPNQENAMLALIERVALTPDADVAKLEKMLELKQKIDADEAEKAFLHAMTQAQSAIPVITASKQNNHTKSKYADLGVILETAKDALAACELTISYTSFPASQQGHYGFKLTVSHVAGHQKEYEIEMPADSSGSNGKSNKNAVQAIGSTATYARRYLFCMAFNIATKDDDGNRAGYVKFIAPNQVAELETIVKSTGANHEAFLNYMRVDRLEEMPAKNFEYAKNELIVAHQRREAQENG